MTDPAQKDPAQVNPAQVNPAQANPAQAPILVRLNGEERSCPSGLSLQAALEHFGYRSQLVVVEFNGEILARRHWPQQLVRQADALEVVTIVGGGS
jgi:sulfur carrier protein